MVSVAEKTWFLYAVLTLMCFAGCNFLLGAIAKEAADSAGAGISATYVIWFTSGGCGLIALAMRRSIKGLGGNLNAFYAAGAGIFMAMASLILALGMAADPASAGPITAMLPLGALFVGVLSRGLLGEKVTVIQIFGMLIAVSGPFCMALANMEANALNGLLLGLAAALSLAFGNFCLKLVGNRGADDGIVLIIMFLVHLVAGITTTAWQYLSDDFLAGLANAKLIMFALGSGILYFFACLFLVLALKGNAGPASATANAGSVGVLILDAIFYSPPMLPLKLIGMGLTICGVTLLALAPPYHVALEKTTTNDSIDATSNQDIENNAFSDAIEEKEKKEDTTSKAIESI